MNMIEALQLLDDHGEKWARPKSWRVFSSGICLMDGQYLHVPSSRGGKPAPIPIPADVSGEWEVVDAKEILYGRQPLE